MAKLTSKTTKALVSSSQTRIEHFSKFASRAILPKHYRAAVGLKDSKPAWFFFDLYAFWEFLCRIDEKLFEKLSDKEYDSVTIGKIIDAIEGNWPFSEKDRERIKLEYEKALKDISKGKIYPL